MAGTVMSTDDPRFYETNSEMIYVPVGVFLAICPVVVGTRVWSRIGNGGKLGPDDYTILVALGCALASDGIMLAACHYGYGRHLATLTPKYKYQAFKYFYLCQVTYKACINLTKASILLLYLRIFGNTRWLRWACRFVLTCVIMYCIASVTATIFQCIPVTKAFDKSLKGTCIDNGHFWYANAGFSIATDVIILTLPMPLVYALQIPKVQKAGLMMVFALGVLPNSVVITSCLRVTTIDIQATTPDPTYDIASTMWTVIEMNVAIVCACLPQIRPLIVKWFPKLMPAYYHSGESPDKHTPCSSSSSSKPYLCHSNRSYAKSEEGKWTRTRNGKADQDGMNLPALRKGDSSSEHTFQDDKGLHIHRTVQYTVEYSPDGKAIPRTGVSV
ncbi:hypothetical protein F4805DRAFT_466886 [Annulohypoxylon moriforme]|nr:hypothetical protein F4805DRAFT_466886 [Annulohypoxylon moriforme]